MLEALYIVEFGDLATQALRNGGVAVLETNRIFGGDSGYYYLGTFTVSGARVIANVTITKHNAAWDNVFGDAALSFDVTLSGQVSGDVISGHMERADKPGLQLPVRLTRKANLP